MLTKEDLGEYLKKNYSYTFYNHKAIKKRGYATGIDVICELFDKDDETEKYEIIENNYKTHEDNNYLFDTLEEALKFKTNYQDKTIEELMINEDPDIVYHVRTVVIDENGNILE